MIAIELKDKITEEIKYFDPAIGEGPQGQVSTFNRPKNLPFCNLGKGARALIMREVECRS